MPFSRTMAAVLLGITLSVGVLFALVITERNAARDALKATQATLKEKKDDLKDTKSELNEFKFKFNGCEASLNQQNIYLSQMQQEAIASGLAASGRADETLAALPSQIANDRAAVTVVSVNKWMGELFR